ncbi:MAG: 4Fe-4S dicluster domain-containing protein, partial [Alistipes sp.]|nr:4Fe-4S dicluster domain-containing protein [Alistipes sp.]
CGRCMAKCHRDVLRMHYKDDCATVWMAYPERCSGCGKCVRVCHMEALYLETESGELSIGYK